MGGFRSLTEVSCRETVLRSLGSTMPNQLFQPGCFISQLLISQALGSLSSGLGSGYPQLARFARR